MITKIGHKNCQVKLHSPDCADWHASIVIKPNREAVIIRHAEETIFINDNELFEKRILKENDIISFSGIETYRFITKTEIIDADPLGTALDKFLTPD